MAATYLSNPNVYNDLESEGEIVRKKFERFLDEYEEVSSETGASYKFYHQEAERLRINKRTTLNISIKHMMKVNLLELVDEITMEYIKIEPYLRRGLRNFMYEICPDYAKEHVFYLGFCGLAEMDGIRDMKSNKIGRLIAIKGTVTKATEVRPELLVGSFTCQLCCAKSGPLDQQFVYTLPKSCINRSCTNKIRFDLVKEGSVYVDWQKIRIQELDSDLPAGATPRSIEVVLRNEIVEQAQPGDRATIVGTLIVVPEVFSMIKPGEKFEVAKTGSGIRMPGQMSMEGISGLSGLGVKDLNYRLVFLANYVSVNENKLAADTLEFANKSETVDQMLANMTKAEKDEILFLSKEPDLFDKLASLIAPSVYSNKEIKKGILLMLFGGVNKRTPEGMKLRGDLNLCIVGDPATAKSQFLKFVYKFIPRTVYTSGKGSTAAGLTAALSRDPETGEFTIEAGALILADNGICCIDEFDKMEEKDVVSIHEAMEQQTISLTKAGIQATLNARCSIIAAANPIMGRYDKTKTLRANINLAPPLMSRFDLFFVVTDECDEKHDTILAKHLLQIHRNFTLKSNHDGVDINGNGENGNHHIFDEKTNSSSWITQSLLQRYLRFAKRLTPRITPEAAKLLEKGYLRMRSNELSIQKSAYRVTVRQLESLIRLSEAIAKVHLELKITPRFVQMAFDLLSKSMINVSHPDVTLPEYEDPQPEEDGYTENKNDVDENNDLPDSDHLKREPKNEQPAELTIDEKLRERKKKTLVITHDEYERISQIIVHILRNSRTQIKRSELINLFLTSDLARINTMEKLSQHEKLVGSIIKRMVDQDKILISTADGPQDNDPLIALHSQFANSLE